jgi:hypothetical protein
LIEPTIRHLAWWLFTRDDGLTEATERELVAKTTEFLHERGYETILTMDKITNLGFATIQCMAAELTFPPYPEEHNFTLLAEAGQLGVALAPYLERRLIGRTTGLPNLPIPPEWSNLFERWAERKANFVDLS